MEYSEVSSLIILSVWKMRHTLLANHGFSHRYFQRGFYIQRFGLPLLMWRAHVVLSQLSTIVCFSDCVSKPHLANPIFVGPWIQPDFANNILISLEDRVQPLLWVRDPEAITLYETLRELCWLSGQCLRLYQFVTLSMCVLSTIILLGFTSQVVTVRSF